MVGLSGASMKVCRSVALISNGTCHIRHVLEGRERFFGRPLELSVHTVTLLLWNHCPCCWCVMKTEPRQLCESCVCVNVCMCVCATCTSDTHYLHA